MKNNTDEPKSSFLSIINTWPEYYETMDEGLGTTYERFILHRYFSDLKQKYEINSVLETPSFGMTGVSGINSLWWSQQGIKPVVVDTNEKRIDLSKKVWQDIPLNVQFNFSEDIHKLSFGDHSFDFTWNFASLWFVENLDDFLSEINRVTKKVIFICVPNHNGIGYKLRDWMNNERISSFFPENIRKEKFIPPLKKLGWDLVKSGYLDIPPWPDIAMKKEDMLKAVGLGFLAKKPKGEDDTPARTCIVDYFNGARPQLEVEILKYDFLEHVPFPIKQLWGHHRYFILEK